MIKIEKNKFGLELNMDEDPSDAVSLLCEALEQLTKTLVEKHGLTECKGCGPYEFAKLTLHQLQKLRAEGRSLRPTWKNHSEGPEREKEVSGHPCQFCGEVHEDEASI